MSTCHRRKAGRKTCRVGTMSLATSCDITRHHAIGSGSGSGAGGVRCHSTEGVAEERRGGGSGSGSGSGRQVGAGSIRGSPYNHRPLDEHRLDAKESGIGRKGIEPKVRARIRRGAPGFLVWNSVTFSGAWARFSEYSQVFPSIP